MLRPDPRMLKRIAVKSLLSAVLTVGAGATLYVTMGVSVLSAVLFVLACGVIAVVTSRI